MANSSAPGSNDFDALARQYWGMWGDAMRGAAPQSAADAGMQGFQDAIKAWTGQAGGSGHGFDNVLGHFGRQNGDWFAQMQQVAAQFAGRDSNARDIANAWRQALGGAGANPFESLFNGMRGPGLEGLEQWSDAAKPFLQGMRAEATSALGMPTFGFTREHQERVQALAQAQLQWQDALSAYNALMGKVSQDAYARFETRLAEREEPGRQLSSARALFDLWIDAAEEAFAASALSPEYRQVYGAMVNAQMTLRSGIQRMVEESASAMGMPGRTELDSAHRKIAELERQNATHAAEPIRRCTRTEASTESSEANRQGCTTASRKTGESGFETCRQKSREEGREEGRQACGTQARKARQQEALT